MTMSKATLNALTKGIAAEHEAKGAKQTSMTAMNAALRNTVMLLIDHISSGENAFNGAAMVKAYYPADDAIWQPRSKNALKSRTADWNIAIDAMRANAATVRAIWPTAEEAEKAELPNTTRAKFLVGCGIIKDKPATAADAVLKVMHAKAAAVFKVPALGAANAGDLLALIKSAGVELMVRDPQVFATFAPDLVAFQTKFLAGRAELKYRTTEELAATQDNDAPAEMSIPAAA